MKLNSRGLLDSLALLVFALRGDVTGHPAVDVCLGVSNGHLQSHPDRCDLFIECSHGQTFVRECGPTLFFNPVKGVCDFRQVTACKPATGGGGRGGGGSLLDDDGEVIHDTVYNLAPVSSGVNVAELRAYCSVVMKEAKAVAMEKLGHEVRLSRQLRGVTDSGPYRGVFNYLKSRPYAKFISKSAIVSHCAVKLIENKFSMPGQRVLDHLRQHELTNILKPLPGQYRSDEPMPIAPDIDYCPYPAKLVCDDHSLTRRTMDGSCNSLVHPLIGRSMIPFRRLVPARYDDGIGEPRRSVTGLPLPGARYISFNLFPDLDRPSRQTTMAFVFFGQLTDHDLTRTALTMVTEDDPKTGQQVVTEVKCGDDGCSTGPGLDACFPIPVPVDDADFAQFNRCLKFVRDMEVPPLDCQVGPREHLNQVTQWLDGSEVYGSTQEEMDLLRDYSDPGRGRMAVTAHPHGNRYKPLLPKEVVTPSMPSECENVNETHVCLQAGDPRVNENAGLGMIHIVLIRHHNHIEEQLHRLNHHWQGEQLFQETRRIMVAALQHITFNEWLPLLLGPTFIRKYELDLVRGGYYKGYDATLDGRVPNEFASAAFRIGHTLLQEKVHRTNEHSQLNDRLFLSETFNKPVHFYDTGSGGVDAFLRGLVEEPSQTFDTFFTKQITRGLFAENPPHGPGLDLLSLNIQRARDHGLGTYNDYREFCGLRRARTFDDLSAEVPREDVRGRLRKLYKDVDDIDIFPGAMSERSVEGGIAGPTFACMIANTFKHLRKADRFWYENEQAGFTPGNLQAFVLNLSPVDVLAQLTEIRKITISRIFCQNADDIKRIQPYIFLQPGRTPVFAQSVEDGLFNKPVACSSLPDIDLNHWKSGP